METKSRPNHHPAIYRTGETLSTYTLSGGSVVANQAEFIGFNGTGTFNHAAGSNTINASTLGYFSVGHNFASSSAYNLSGTGSLSVNEDEYIG